MRSRLALALAALVLGACSGGPPKPKPTPLESLKPEIAGRQVWSQRIGDINYPLGVATGGVYAYRPE